MLQNFLKNLNLSDDHIPLDKKMNIDFEKLHINKKLHEKNKKITKKFIKENQVWASELGPPPKGTYPLKRVYVRKSPPDIKTKLNKFRKARNLFNKRNKKSMGGAVGPNGIL